MAVLAPLQTRPVPALTPVLRQTAIASRLAGLLRDSPDPRKLCKKQNTGGAMAEDNTPTGHSEARAMLDVFVSVGANRFDVTLTTRAGEKHWFRRNVPLAELTGTLPARLAAATACQRNLIVRPHGAGVAFIQLDDLNADQLPRLASAMFRTLETSPGNFQAGWRCRAAWTKSFPAASAGAPELTRPRAAQRAFPEASISKTSRRQIFRA
jgi:hypothetical protein